MCIDQKTGIFNGIVNGFQFRQNITVRVLLSVMIGLSLIPQLFSGRQAVLVVGQSQFTGAGNQ